MTKTGKTVFILFFALIVFGFAILSSASIVLAQKTCGSGYCMLFHQFLYGLIPGLIVMYICSRIDVKMWRKLSLPILLISIVGMVLVFVPGVGISVNGAARWIDLGFTTLQPSEFLKFGLVLYLAAWFSERRKQAGSISSLVPFLLILILVGALLVLQPDFGTLGIVVLIGVGVYFFSGAKMTHFSGLIAVFFIAVLALSFASPYRFNRIKTFLNPHEDRQATGYHINQAKIAIGSGGIFGVGYSSSTQKTGFLPEPVGDSIFAIMVEELGLVGGGFYLALLMAFLWFLVRLGLQSRDFFSTLFVLGVAVWIGGQAFINIAAISGLVPLTGIPLPLVSYGSSSLVAIMASMGVVWKVGT